MTINLSMPATHQLKPRITVVGVGGAGGNAVNNMITSHLEGVEFVVANTDAQALAQSLSERRIQLGINITQGLGAGSQPDVGRAAAEEAIDEILENLDGSNMVFITAGMGGGTGTGGAPVVARAAREQGVLTVGVVTKPFQFEGVHRMRLAEEGLAEQHARSQSTPGAGLDASYEPLEGHRLWPTTAQSNAFFGELLNLAKKLPYRAGERSEGLLSRVGVHREEATILSRDQW